MEKQTMDVKSTFIEIYDDSLEKALPSELIDRYWILECLNSSEGCYTLLVSNRSTEQKYIAKCYSKHSSFFTTAEPEIMTGIQSDAIPRFEGEYNNEEYRCVLREYVEGVSLYEYVKLHRLTEEEISNIAIKLSAAMKKLHDMENPVIHRDIKPQNIIVKNDGSIVLIDLGISRIYKEEECEDTVLAGTQVFMSPEQYGFRQTDSRSDIYSFGVVLVWMLTGQTKPIQKPHTELEKIAYKCCEFAPEKRFQNDEMLIRALLKTLPEHSNKNSMRRKSIGINIMVLLVGVCLGFLMHTAISDGRFQGGIKFKEPMIEQAVRVMLDKPSGKITKQDLEMCQEIYIHGRTILTSQEEFFQNAEMWYDEGMPYGEISDLSDLAMMPNLRAVYIGAQYIKDITPLENLEKLEYVELRCNEIEDITPLKNKKYLRHIGLSFSNITEVDTFSTCPVLSAIDLREAGHFDGRPAADWGVLSVLDIVGCDTDLYNYLDGKRIDVLKLGTYGQKDLECIRNIEYIKELHIDYSDIRDISALEGREDITYLNMSGCVISDIGPIFSLPYLTRIDLSENIKNKFETYVRDHDIHYDFEVVFNE